jgi:hypothetical protein
MANYEDEEIFPASLDEVWRLLEAHNDPLEIVKIHPLVRSQEVVLQDGGTVLADRVIDARGRRLRSRWKVTMAPPDRYRWEVVSGEGPWSAGSYLENRFEAAAGGTLVRTRAELTFSVLPFFLPQGYFARRTMNEIGRQDLAYARAHPSG